MLSNAEGKLCIMYKYELAGQSKAQLTGQLLKL